MVVFYIPLHRVQICITPHLFITLTQCTTIDITACIAVTSMGSELSVLQCEKQLWSQKSAPPPGTVPQSLVDGITAGHSTPTT